MNYTVQELALQYAEFVVKFHQANNLYYKNSDLKMADTVFNNLNAALEAMEDAWDRLNDAAKRHVDLLTTA